MNERANIEEEMNAKAKIEEERNQLINKSKLKKYRVILYFLRKESFGVTAVDEEHARILTLKSSGYRESDIENIKIYEE